MVDKLVYKQNKSAGYNLLMAYPESEAFALSSLGYMWLFMLADIEDGIHVQRISTDSLCSNNKQADAVSFSMSFDFDYIGVLKILDKLNIPFFSKDRTKNHPIVFAAKPCVCLISVCNDFSGLSDLSCAKSLRLMANSSFTDTSCCFDQQTAKVRIPCLGKAKPFHTCRTGMLSRRQTQVCCIDISFGKTYKVTGFHDK